MKNKKQNYSFFWAISLALFLIIILISNRTIFADSEKDTTLIIPPVASEENAYQATVKIIVPIFDEKDKKIYSGNGTGWVAGAVKIKGEKIVLVVTNSHVVASLVSGEHPELVKEPRAVVFYDKNKKKIGGYPFGVLVYSDSKLKRQDIAVLGVVGIPDNLDLFIYNIEGNFPEKGEKVTTIGFPSDNPGPVKKEFKVTVSGGGKKSFDGCAFSGEAGPGQSGSPVFNDKFKVIGMIWGYIDYNLILFKKRINYLVPIDELQTYIDDALEVVEKFDFKTIKGIPIAQDPRE